MDWRSNSDWFARRVTCEEFVAILEEWVAIVEEWSVIVSVCARMVVSWLRYRWLSVEWREEIRRSN